MRQAEVCCQHFKPLRGFGRILDRKELFSILTYQVPGARGPLAVVSQGNSNLLHHVDAAYPMPTVPLGLFALKSLLLAPSLDLPHLASWCRYTGNRGQSSPKTNCTLGAWV